MCGGRAGRQVARWTVRIFEETTPQVPSDIRVSEGIAHNMHALINMSQQPHEQL